ncbi:MAG: LLM class flavin-dependent oxidoreductase [Chitinophagaceae bacterium]
MSKIPLSVLDLAIVTQGGNFSTAIERSVLLAQHAEQLGYKRFWLAEHHNMKHVASSATAVLIGHVAGSTNSIRVGSGGIMLPNHSTLAIAEQFGTLDALYPGRIDLGLGRAPGTDQATAMALRRNFADGAYDFGEHIMELQHYFGNTNEAMRVRAFPGEGAKVPIWILGSSTDSAYLAAAMGLPYAFAAHFAPAQFEIAVKIYQQNFRPSPALQKPYTMACVNVVGADTDAEAQLLSTSIYQMFLGIISGQRKPLQAPTEKMDELWDAPAKAAVEQMTHYTFAGNKNTLRKNLNAFIAANGVDELMVTSNVYDNTARLKSFSILNEAMSE